MSNQEVIKSLLSTDFQQKDFHLYSKTCVDNMMKEVLTSKSMDNLTAVMISFKSLFNFYTDSKAKGKLNKIQGQSVGDQEAKIEEVEYFHDTEDAIITQFEN
jgi:hypothetical protein